MMLSNDDLRAITKSLGRTAGATEAMLDRVDGQLYSEKLAELEHIQDLMARLAAEQMERRRRTA
jgi:hypothetical protein